MAINFVTASTEYYEVDQNLINTDVFTVSAWIYVTSLSADNCIMWSGDKDVSNKFFRFMTDASTGTITFTARNTSSQDAVTSTSISTNTWYNVIGVSASSSDRRVYLNNGGVGTNTTSVSGIDSITDRFSIGRMGDSTPGKDFSGRICEFAIWNYALGAEERQALADAATPDQVNPEALIMYRKMVNTSFHNDMFGTANLTPNGTPDDADHAPVRELLLASYTPYWAPPAGGATGKSNPLDGPLGGPLTGAIGL